MFSLSQKFNFLFMFPHLLLHKHLTKAFDILHVWNIFLEGTDHSNMVGTFGVIPFSPHQQKSKLKTLMNIIIYVHVG